MCECVNMWLQRQKTETHNEKHLNRHFIQIQSKSNFGQQVNAKSLVTTAKLQNERRKKNVTKSVK